MTRSSPDTYVPPSRIGLKLLRPFARGWRFRQEGSTPHPHEDPHPPSEGSVQTKETDGIAVRDTPPSFSSRHRDRWTARTSGPRPRSVGPQRAAPVRGRGLPTLPGRSAPSAPHRDVRRLARQRPPGRRRRLNPRVRAPAVAPPWPPAAAAAPPATARAARTAPRRGRTARPPAAADRCERSASLISSQLRFTSAADDTAVEPNTCGWRLISFAARVSATSSMVKPPSTAARSAAIRAWNSTWSRTSPSSSRSEARSPSSTVSTAS